MVRLKNLTEEKNFLFIVDLNIGEEDSSMWAESADNVPTKRRKSGKLPSPQMLASPSAKNLERAHAHAWDAYLKRGGAGGNSHPLYNG